MKHKKDTKQDEISETNTRCGIGWFSPKWLQIFASKKAFVVVYALAGMQMNLLGSYFVGTLSTTEKNFNMSTKMSGIITGAWDIGSLLTNLVVTYVAAKGHRTRWVALGMFFVSISSFMRTLPYLIYGGGENIKLYTKEYGGSINDTNFYEGIGNITGIKKLSTNVNCEKSNTSFSDTMAFYTFVIAQMITGLGTAVYWTCGAAYLDDNARKNVVPMLLAFVQAIRLFGPTIGFILSAYVLKIYVEPGLTPNITSEDPRWIGAWWIGWYPIGIACLLSAIALALFPKVLPRAALRKKNDPSVTENSLSVADFSQSLKRILRNKIIVFNSLSSVSFIIGLLAYWTFMPKYMESQFRLSPSKSNFLTGTVGILSNALGIMTSGVVISKLRPSPRFLAGWNVFVELLDAFGRIGYAWLSCPPQKYHGHRNEDQSWNLTETCNVNYNCGTDIQYNPVCDLSRELVFYSPCHAGCTSTSMINNTLTYGGCKCVDDGMGSIVEGLCPADCSSNILIFILMMGFLSFTSATGRSCNTLIQFRCVDEKDKSLSIGVTESFLALLAFMPAPILYGILMDWTCMVWGDNCGSQGNCWIYDSEKLRLSFNLTASAFLFLGTILDCFVWYHVKDLQIYDEDFLDNSTNKKTANQALKEKFETKNQPRDEIELPLVCTKRSNGNNIK